MYGDDDRILFLEHRSKMIKDYKWYLMFLVLLTLTFFLQFSAKHEILPITNHFIVDSHTYEVRVLYEHNVDFFANTFTSANRFLYEIGPFSFIIVNSIMILMSIYLCKIFENISSNSVSLAKFFVVFNPYLLVGAIGPNKETVLLFLSLLCFYLFFQKLSYIKFLGFIVAIAAVFVRPVFGLVLVTTILSVPFLSIFKNPVRFFILILVFYFIGNSIPPINTILTESQGEDLVSFQSSNLYQVALFLKLMNQNPILQFPAFLMKTGLILITPIVRPNSFYSIPYPILDVGFTFMAYCLFTFNLSLLLLFPIQERTSLEMTNRNSQILILYCLIGILTTIINSNITFRYIFPYSPIIVSLFYLHSVKVRNRLLIFSLFILALTFTCTSIFFRREFEIDNSLVPQFMSWF